MTTNFKQVQAQPFSLAGGGAIAGATSIILKSFAQINGTLLTMTNFGSIGYGTLEPGNGTLEEQISFTGVTQNSNGTATLTGVSTIGMVSPYTSSSGLAQTHAGSTSFVLSNTAGFYDQFVAKNDDATLTGKLTFPGGGDTNAPVSGTVYAAPTADLEYASKKYVDSVAIAGAPNANTTTKGIVQMATQAQVDAGTATGSTGAALTPSPDILRSRLLSDYVADTGAANAYVITPSPTITALTAGQRFSFKVKTTNTTTSTLVVNALTGTAIFKLNGAQNLVAGDLVAGQVVEVEYNGINGFQLMNPVASPTLAQSGKEIYAADSVGTDSYAVTLVPAIAAYSTGLVVNFKAGTANTGAATLAVNGLSAIAIKKQVSAALNDGDIAVGQIVTVIYDGTNFQMQSPSTNLATFATGVQNLGPYTTTANSDTTVTTNFTPRLIRLYYIIQGHTGSGSTNVYTAMKGIATYSATTLISNYIIWSADGSASSLALTGDQGTLVSAFTGLNFPSTVNDTAAPVTGEASGSNNDIQTTLTINSVSATGFVVRVATNISSGTNTSNARANFAWEAFA